MFELLCGFVSDWDDRSKWPLLSNPPAIFQVIETIGSTETKGEIRSSTSVCTATFCGDGKVKAAIYVDTLSCGLKPGAKAIGKGMPNLHDLTVSAALDQPLFVDMASSVLHIVDDRGASSFNFEENDSSPEAHLRLSSTTGEPSFLINETDLNALSAVFVSLAGIVPVSSISSFIIRANTAVFGMENGRGLVIHEGIATNIVDASGSSSLQRLASIACRHLKLAPRELQEIILFAYRKEPSLLPVNENCEGG